MLAQQNLVNVGVKVYTITKQIGFECYGAIYKGMSEKGEEVAIKYKQTTSKAEYEILQNLSQNPKAHIIGIKGVQREITGKTIIVMEQVDEDLYSYMTNNPEFRTLSKDQNNQIFYQMVEAIKDLHELECFHRDVKPENFGVFKKNANGYVKTILIDLGLCTQKQYQMMQHTQNIGTPFYMAPEIINGSQLYDHTVDSWALGCIWFEIMIGNHQNEVFQNILNCTQEQIDLKIESQQIFNVNEKELLKKLIQKEASKRIEVKELAQRLQAIQNNNQMISNFNNVQNINTNEFNQSNALNAPQFSQFQNQNFQQQYSQNNDWILIQQQQMQQEYEQKLKEKPELQKQEIIEKIRKEEEDKQKQRLLDEQKREKFFIETKNKVKKQIQNSKESIQKFISSLEEKSKEKLVCESQSVVPKQYQEFYDSIQNFINLFKSKILKIEEDENAIQQIENLSQVQEIDTQLSQYIQQVIKEQLDTVNLITQNQNELIQQLINQKFKLKEKQENQVNKQINQRQKLQEQYLSYWKQIQQLKSNLKNQQRKSKLLISQNEISIKFQQIDKKLKDMYSKINEIESKEKNLGNQEISIQIIHYNYFNFQLLEIIEELKQFQNQGQQLYQNAEIELQDFTEQTNKKIQQFQDSVETFDICCKKCFRDQEQLSKELVQFQNQESYFMIQQKVTESQEQVMQMQKQFKEFETMLNELKQNLNYNQMVICSNLIQGLTEKQNEFLDQESKINQFNQQISKIIIQQYQILQLNEENKKIFQQLDQQQQSLFMIFYNFSNLSQEMQQQIDILNNDFNSLKNEFKNELQKLNIEHLETEEQFNNCRDANQRIINTFILKFEEKKNEAEILQQMLFQHQALQDENEKILNQFNIQCNKIIQTLSQFRFDYNFEIFDKIRHQSYQQEMNQCLEYKKESQNSFNESYQVCQEFERILQSKKSFERLKNVNLEDISNFKNNLEKAMRQHNKFFDEFIQPYHKENFDQIELEDNQNFLKLIKCKEIQSRAQNLSQHNLKQFQKPLNIQSDIKEFINKLQKDIVELIDYQNILQEMNLIEIYQLNERIPNKVNSWFIQILLITLIISYQKEELFLRKFDKDEKKISVQLKQLLNESNTSIGIMLKCQSYLDSQQFNELKIEDLIENLGKIKESKDEQLNIINEKNSDSLREKLKNQQIMKEMIEITKYNKFSHILLLKKFEEQQRKMISI